MLVKDLKRMLETLDDDTRVFLSTGGHCMVPHPILYFTPEDWAEKVYAPSEGLEMEEDIEAAVDDIVRYVPKNSVIFSGSEFHFSKIPQILEDR
jgi:hypothetical protein